MGARAGGIIQSPVRKLKNRCSNVRGQEMDVGRDEGESEVIFLHRPVPLGSQQVCSVTESDAVLSRDAPQTPRNNVLSRACHVDM